MNINIWQILINLSNFFYKSIGNVVFSIIIKQGTPV